MAKDIITRFKLETTQYDSKLRDAAKELVNFTKTATQAGKGFNDFTKAQIDAARAIGNTASGATNLKDKLKDTVSAFNNLAKTYNALTDSQRQSDFGRAMSESLTKLQQTIRETKQEMEGLNGAGKNIGGGLFGGGTLSNMVSVFGGNIMTKAAGAVASLAFEIKDCVKEGIELAKQGEGVRNAFERLGRGDILQGLRDATHGTVTDIELMKAAVKFDDFKLPVEELGTMLAFAQQKAKDTGQSVDYMVDSIVTGLGRKSLMILDNLGLSATEIREKMKETGDMTKAVGAIIREQMSQAGDYVETAADRAAQANVNLQNKMEELGRKFAPVEEASNQLWTSMKIGILDIIGGPLAQLLNSLSEAGRLQNAINDVNKGGGENQTLAQKKLGVLRHYSGSQKGVTKQTIYDRTIAGYNKEEEKANRAAMYYRNKRLETEKRIRNVNVRRDESGVQAGFLKKQADSYREREIESRNRAQAYRLSKAEYIKGAQAILHPQKVNTNTFTPTVDKPKVTHHTTSQITPREQATNQVNEAERTYSETMQKASVRFEKGLDDTLTFKKKELSAQERLFDAYSDAYNTYKSPAIKKKQEEAADEIGKLSAEVKKETDAQKNAQEAARKLEAEQKKAAEALAKRTALEESWKTPTLSSIGSLTQDITTRRNESAIGSAEFNSLSANLVDITSLNSIINASLENGINIDPAVTQSIMQQIVSGTDIDDSVWTDLENTINTHLAELGLDPIKLDFKTGNLKKEAKGVEEGFESAAGAIQAVGSAMSQVEDPAVKVMGIVAEAIATIALTFAKSLKGTITPWDWIAAAAAGTSTMIGVISAIHSSTGYANGGMIKGNTYSGDQLMAQGPDGGLIGLNAGEIVLNKAAQGNLASQLNDNSNATPRLMAEVSAEQIRFVIRNNRRRENISETALFR